MNDIYELTPGVFFVGVDDRETPYFDSLWPLPTGMAYNSYLVRGSEKTALIEGTELAELNAFWSRLEQTAPGVSVDYLIVNHMEPDHTASVPALLARFPGMKIVGNKMTLSMMKNYYGVDEARFVCIVDGDTLDLGGKTLKFFLTPMVHWPETMMTYLVEDAVLFSCDAFGSYGTHDGAITDAQTDPEPYFNQVYRYYSNIVAKYGRFVTSALKKLEGLKINVIAPSHGLVWINNIPRIVQLYADLAQYKAEKGVTIVYGTMYGNTKKVADRIASRLDASGVGPIRVHRATFDNLSFIYADIMRYDTLVVCSPTYSMELYPPIEAMMSGIKMREFRDRRVAVVGSYTWAPKVAVNKLTEGFTAMGMPPVAQAQLCCGNIDAAKAAVDALADTLINKQ